MPVTDLASANAYIANATVELGSLSAALEATQCEVLRVAAAANAFVDLFPSNNLHQAIGRLCRCRGMIQEVNPEMSLFPASPQQLIRSPTGGGDTTASSSITSYQEELVDAVLLYVIPVPGNSHFYEALGPAATTSAGCAPSASHTASPTGSRKRANVDDDEEGEGTEHSPDAAATTAVAGENERRPFRPAADPSNGSSTSTNGRVVAPATLEDELNHPHPSTSPGLRTSCIVTVLQPRSCNDGTVTTDVRNALRTNAVVDFYGFLHFPDDQTQPSLLEGDELAQFSSWYVAELAKGLVSRLLCLGWQPVLAPLLIAPAPDVAANSRLRTLRHLTDTLCRGDELLAEYVLLHLCGHVASHSTVTPVGDVPLLICAPDAHPAQVSRELSRVVPVAEIFLDRRILTGREGTGPIAVHPRQDAQRNYLRTGLLQLGNGSHVTIDCAGLDNAEGSGVIAGATPTGERAHASWSEVLFGVIHKQILPLDYTYQTIELAVDLSFLAVAAVHPEGQVAPMLRFPLRVNWEPVSIPTGLADEAVGAAGAAVPSAADAARHYLEMVSRITPSFIGEGDGVAVRDAITEAFVALSAMCPAWNNRDPLIHNNTFSAVTALIRAHAASLGRGSVTVDDVAHIIALEQRRAARLRVAS